MINKYFLEEKIEQNDLYFMCYMIERVARHIHQHNKYVINTIGRDELYRLFIALCALKGLRSCTRRFAF